MQACGYVILTERRVALGLWMNWNAEPRPGDKSHRKVSMLVRIFVCVCVRVSVDQRSTFVSFLRHCPFFQFYKKNSHSSLELSLRSRLTGQRAPEIPSLYIPSVRIASTYHPQLFLFVFYGFWVWNSDPPGCKTRTLLTEPSPLPHLLKSYA